MNMKQRLEELQRYGDEFHKHIEECQRCQQQPFNLCETGSRLINLAGGMSPEAAEQASKRTVAA